MRDERRELALQEIKDTGFLHAAEFARRHGVSRATIWRDIDELVRRGLVVKVHGGAGAPPESVAVTSRLRRPQTALVIGMQVPSDTYYFAEVSAGAREACDGLGVQLVVAVSGYFSDQDETESIRGLVAAGADGLLLSPSGPRTFRDGGVASALLRSVQVPGVLVDREPAGLAGPSWAAVSTAREAGVHAAVEHLADLGHRRIGFLTTMTQSPVRSAIMSGYRSAMADVLDLAPGEVDGWVWSERAPAATLLSQLLDADLTAVVVFNDAVAVNLALAARAAGVDIPGRLSIVSYDHGPAASASPTLTAVHPPRREIGALAARLLLNHLAGGGELGGRRISVEPRLVVGESTGPVPD